jgi:hypothetical protein
MDESRDQRITRRSDYLTGKHAKTADKPGIAVGTDDNGRTFAYRPGEVLVHELGLMEDGRRLHEEFGDEGTPIEGVPCAGSAGRASVPSVLRRLRRDPRLRNVRLGPNHVLWW